MSEWDELSEAAKWHIEHASRQLAELAWNYTTTLIITEEGEEDEAASTASGFLLDLDGRAYLLTADHVVASYLTRRTRTRYSYIQAGMLGIDALDRIVYRDKARDVAAVSLANLDLERANALPYRPLGLWPPLAPRRGDAVQFCGFPKAFRTYPAVGELDFGALPGHGLIESVGPGYCTMVIERQKIQVFGKGSELPPASTFGGLSGGPVLLFGALAYPIVGLVSEVSEQFDIMRFATLDGLPPRFE